MRNCTNNVEKDTTVCDAVCCMLCISQNLFLIADQQQPAASGELGPMPSLNIETHAPRHLR